MPEISQVVACDSGHCAALADNLLVVVWRGEPHEEKVRKMIDPSVALAREKANLGVVIVVENGSRIPVGSARQAMAEHAQLLAPHIMGMASVFEGTGFGVAAVRAVMTGIGLLVGPPYPHKLFATVSSASVWMSEILKSRGDQSPEPTAIQEAIAAVRSRMPQ
jgi:hypothetical protein